MIIFYCACIIQLELLFGVGEKCCAVRLNFLSTQVQVQVSNYQHNKTNKKNCKHFFFFINSHWTNCAIQYNKSINKINQGCLVRVFIKKLRLISVVWNAAGRYHASGQHYATKVGDVNAPRHSTPMNLNALCPKVHCMHRPLARNKTHRGAEFAEKVSNGPVTKTMYSYKPSSCTQIDQGCRT
jgi:hypothetical protein